MNKILSILERYSNGKTFVLKNRGEKKWQRKKEKLNLQRRKNKLKEVLKMKYRLAEDDDYDFNDDYGDEDFDEDN